MEWTFLFAIQKKSQKVGEPFVSFLYVFSLEQTFWSFLEDKWSFQSSKYSLTRKNTQNRELLLYDCIIKLTGPVNADINNIELKVCIA